MHEDRPAQNPPQDRVFVFVDGANLYNSVKRSFGYPQPNADIARLALTITNAKANRKLLSVSYYIGVPRVEQDAVKSGWWNRKLSAMGRSKVNVIRRDLKRRELNIEISGLVTHRSNYQKLIEKGIDLRLGLDLVGRTLDGSFDVAIIFSQDGDLAEAIDDAYVIAKSQNRSITIECAYPVGAPERNGIHRTVWCPFDKALYDTCIDFGKY